MDNFLKEADYFKCIERNKEILAFLIALGPGKITKALITNGLKIDMILLCMLIELLWVKNFKN